MKLALDLESVLADTNEVALQSTDKLDPEHFEDGWGLSDKQWETYVKVTDAAWRHNPQSIPPEEENIDRYVSKLREAGNEIHILTAREWVDEQILWWLEEKEIEYDSFESTSSPKHEYDYDIFIDDNPELWGECRLLLRDQPWNNHIDTSSSRSSHRIYSLEEVNKFI